MYIVHNTPLCPAIYLLSYWPISSSSCHPYFCSPFSCYLFYDPLLFPHLCLHIPLPIDIYPAPSLSLFLLPYLFLFALLFFSPSPIFLCLCLCMSHSDSHPLSSFLSISFFLSSFTFSPSSSSPSPPPSPQCSFPLSLYLSLEMNKFSHHSVITLACNHIKGKDYTAHYPVRWTAQSASHFTSWQTSDTNSASLGSILGMRQLRATTIHSHFHHCL